uniref:Uncharacterized protein n=1 Tax=Stegastes partitus TaxID=144197 RepID=A0A3B4Z2K9_9TELE
MSCGCPLTDAVSRSSSLFLLLTSLVSTNHRSTEVTSVQRLIIELMLCLAQRCLLQHLLSCRVSQNSELISCQGFSLKKKKIMWKLLNKINGTL